MSGPTTSQHWYRIAPLKPELREHVELHRHFYRGSRTYMLQDMSTGAFHRFESYQIRSAGPDGLLDTEDDLANYEIAAGGP